MTEPLTTTAQECLDAAYEGTMDFPAIVRALMDAGFEGYEVDYRRGTSTYFTASGEHVELTLPRSDTPIAAKFNTNEVEQAVREAQRKAPGYTYAGFCAKVKAAGCAGYMVSFLGRRVVYFGRTAETHVEHFPR
ncbi:DUF1398 family protein [Myxococcus sp. K38C18041901]|uniref:DUF1398 domain-containing protein n=1 Tax=Myxococcus guangdongensis TaxID=2906760 RepID=UPI0020A7D5F8|nr:DUF1398 family protein [Myxococcus guangdongensis]MCP3059068.1 DUF1398 family protein [Myxococcus guangdongensis]